MHLFPLSGTCIIHLRSYIMKFVYIPALVNECTICCTYKDWLNGTIDGSSSLMQSSSVSSSDGPLSHELKKMTEKGRLFHLKSIEDS